LNISHKFTKDFEDSSLWFQNTTHVHMI